MICVRISETSSAASIIFRFPVDFSISLSTILSFSPFLSISKFFGGHANDWMSWPADSGLYSGSDSLVNMCGKKDGMVEVKVDRGHSPTSVDSPLYTYLAWDAGTQLIQSCVERITYRFFPENLENS